MNDVIIYRAVYGAPLTDAQAERYGRELDRLIAEKPEKSIKPDEVVEAAKLTTSPLHEWFTWDDKKAANGFRHDEAKALLRYIITEVRTAEEVSVEVRVFDSIKTPSGPAYASIQTTIKSPELSSYIIKMAFKSLKAWRDKYRRYSMVFGPVFDAIDNIQL